MITDKQVIAFANNLARPMADRFYGDYFRAKSVIQNYNSGNIGTLISNAGAGNVIDDGALADGRTQITGGDIFNLVTALMDFVAYVEGGAVATANRIDVITKPHANNF